jgi:hypothetical protein
MYMLVYCALCCYCTGRLSPNRCVQETQAVPDIAALSDETGFQRDNTGSVAAKNESHSHVCRNTPMKLETIELFKSCVCKITDKAQNVAGSGFVCRIKIPDKGNLIGIMTCAHVVPDVEDKTKQENYEITFERGTNCQEATRTLKECIKGVIVMPKELDAVFVILENKTANIYWENSRVKDVVDIRRQNVYAEGRQFFYLGHPHGGLLHFGQGEIEHNSLNGVLVPHSARTDKGFSGSPLIDTSTEKIIAIHKGNLDLSKNTFIDKDIYSKCAIKIVPIVKFIGQYYCENLDPSYLYAPIVAQGLGTDSDTPNQVRSSEVVLPTPDRDSLTWSKKGYRGFCRQVVTSLRRGFIKGRR